MTPTDSTAGGTSTDGTAGGTSTSIGAGAGTAAAAHRSNADRMMRRILRLPVDAPKQSIMGTESVFGKSIVISGLRCTLTYLVLPLLFPIFKLSGKSLPVLGLVLGVVSMVAITISMRRFFAADHKYRWGYAFMAVAIFGLLIVAGVKDVQTLFNA